MGKNKIMNKAPILTEEDISFGEEMLFKEFSEENLPPKSESNVKEKALKSKTNKINILNFVDVSEKMLYSISNFSLFTQKLFYTAISEIKENDESFQEIVFKVTDIVDKFKMDKSNVWRALRKATKELFESKVYAWNEQTKELEVVHIFSKMKLAENNKVVKILFDKQVSKYFLKLSNYFYKVPLGYLLDLHSQNSMKIFHLLFGYYYYNKNSYLKKKNRKISNKNNNEEETLKLVVPYEQLRMLFEAEKYNTFIDTGKLGEDKYPTLKKFSRSVLDYAIKDINEQGILHIELEKIKGKQQIFFEDTTPFSLDIERNGYKVSHLVFKIKAGKNLEQLEQDRQNIKADDALLTEICEYFKTRFDISYVITKKLFRTGYSYEKLMLSAIAMQSILNFSSRGLWIYTKDKDNDPNWQQEKIREQTYIKEYLKISLPNLGASFDNEKKFHQFVIKKPVGFLKKTLKEELYLSTIDFINKQSTLASITSNTNEKLCTASLYDNTGYGEQFKNCIKRYNTDKDAKEMGAEFDLIHDIFNFFCRDSALKLNPNTKWKEYFYNGLNELDIYWKAKKYEQHPERQQSIKKTVDRILSERNLND